MLVPLLPLLAVSPIPIPFMPMPLPIALDEIGAEVGRNVGSTSSTWESKQVHGIDVPLPSVSVIMNGVVLRLIPINAASEVGNPLSGENVTTILKLDDRRCIGSIGLPESSTKVRIMSSGSIRVVPLVMLKI